MFHHHIADEANRSLARTTEMEARNARGADGRQAYRALSGRLLREQALAALLLVGFAFSLGVGLLLGPWVGVAHFAAIFALYLLLAALRVRAARRLRAAQLRAFERAKAVHGGEMR